MRRRVLLLFAPLALAALAPTSGNAARPAAVTKRRAEVNVLRVVATKWAGRRLPGLVNPRTHLLVDNTEAICRGRGKRLTGHRYTRFVCVVRPHLHSPRQGLNVSYRALPGGRFRIRWLAYRRR
jgi:hypothetical protein